MRTLGRIASLGVLWWGLGALADPNDFRIYQLGNPTSNANANANFEAFAREFGAALSSANLMPPGTLGHAGFSVTAEISTVYMNAVPVTDGTSSVVDKRPQNGGFYMPTEYQGSATSPGLKFNSGNPLLLPSIHVRKGLPFSFELGARIALIDKSQMAAGTAEVRWAVNEGFAFLPDICVRGHVTRLFNTPDFSLATAGFDLGVGKRFAIGGMITLTPYAGWDLTWVGAGSNMVDFNPQRSYLNSVSSTNTQIQDDTGIFKEVSIGQHSHNRFYGGVRFIGGIIQLGAEISYAALGQVAYPDGNVALPGVTALNGTVGLDF